MKNDVVGLFLQALPREAEDVTDLDKALRLPRAMHVRQLLQYKPDSHLRNALQYDHSSLLRLVRPCQVFFFYSTLLTH